MARFKALDPAYPPFRHREIDRRSTDLGGFQRYIPKVFVNPENSSIKIERAAQRQRERTEREREGMGRRTKKCPSQISVDLDLDLDSPSVKLTLRDTEGARCGCTLIRRSCAERQSSRSRPEISRLSITRPCGDIDHGVVAGSCVDLPFHR